MLSASAFGSAGNTYFNLDYSGYHKEGCKEFYTKHKSLEGLCNTINYRDSNIEMNTSIILHKQAQKHKSLALLYWHQRIRTDVAEKGGIGEKCLACKAGVFWSGIHELFSGMTLSCHLGR